MGEMLLGLMSAWFSLKVVRKLALITSVVTAGTAIAAVFLAAMKTLFEQISPSLHPMVIKGMSLAPPSTMTYLSICVAAVLTRWFYDQQWTVLKWALGGPK